MVKQQVLQKGVLTSVFNRCTGVQQVCLTTGVLTYRFINYRCLTTAVFTYRCITYSCINYSVTALLVLTGCIPVFPSSASRGAWLGGPGGGGQATP